GGVPGGVGDLRGNQVGAAAEEGGDIAARADRTVDAGSPNQLGRQIAIFGVRSGPGETDYCPVVEGRTRRRTVNRDLGGIIAGWGSDSDCHGSGARAPAGVGHSSGDGVDAAGKAFGEVAAGADRAVNAGSPSQLGSQIAIFGIQSAP